MIETIAIIIASTLAGSLAMNWWAVRKALSKSDQATEAKDLARTEGEQREDAEDERDQWKAQSAKTAEEKSAAIKRVMEVETELKASRAAFAAYIAKKQATASDEEAVSIMDDLIARRLGV